MTAQDEADKLAKAYAAGYRQGYEDGKYVYQKVVENTPPKPGYLTDEHRRNLADWK